MVCFCGANNDSLKVAICNYSSLLGTNELKTNLPLLTLASKRARETTPNELGSHFLHLWSLSDDFLSFEDFLILRKNFDQKKNAAREAFSGYHFSTPKLP